MIDDGLLEFLLGAGDVRTREVGKTSPQPTNRIGTLIKPCRM